MRSFASDNNAGVHPAVMNALIQVNQDHAVGYGDDEWTVKAKERFNELFGVKTDVYFVYNGTGANITALQSVCSSFQSVITSQSAHINVDECGAPEKMIGGKIHTIHGDNGKIQPEDIIPFLSATGFEHHSQPRVISITQVTELGTVYTLNEIKELCDFAHSNDLIVHMDGARITNALVALKCTIKDMTTDLGVDVVSFGGTKNGLMFGEAVVFLNPDLSKYTKYIRKQSSQLHSKMRYISSQYLEYLSNDLWIKNAAHANKMAKLLAEKLMSVPQIKISRPVESNAVFAIVPESLIEPLQQQYFFYIWDHQCQEVRWMTSFDTTEDDITGFIYAIKTIIKDGIV